MRAPPGLFFQRHVVVRLFPGRTIHGRGQHGHGQCLASDAARDRAARSGIHDVTRGVPFANGRAGWVGQPAGDPIGDPLDLPCCFDLRGPQSRKVGRKLDKHAAAGKAQRGVVVPPMAAVPLTPGPHPADAVSESRVVAPPMAAVPLTPGPQHQPLLVLPRFDVASWSYQVATPLVPRVDSAAGALAGESAPDAGGGGAGSRVRLPMDAFAIPGIGALCSTACLG